jgi:hypothetical protein
VQILGAFRAGEVELRLTAPGNGSKGQPRTLLLTSRGARA